MEFLFAVYRMQSAAENRADIFIELRLQKLVAHGVLLFAENDSFSSLHDTRCQNNKSRALHCASTANS